jgi:hypothetical protein
MAISVQAVRSQIESDKQLALEAMGTVDDCIEKEGEPIVPVDVSFTEEIPASVQNYLDYKLDRMISLRDLREVLFFSRINVEITNPDGRREPRKYLVSKARLVGGVSKDDWFIAGWTAPITAKILDQPVGTESTLGPSDRRKTPFRITATAKFGKLLPNLEDTTYDFSDGTFYVEHEDRLPTGPAKAAPKRAVKYKATEQFGLNEIIELADPTQREAMHLPFHDTVLVEGPPGSGKTSIALMRVPCLIDRQWDELGLKPDKDGPLHQQSTMQVLVMNEEMTQYLHTLISSIGVPKIGVITFNRFFQQLCRRCQMPGGRTVEESPALTRAKYHVSARQAYWAGFQAAVADRWERKAAELRAFLLQKDEESGESLYRCLDRWVSEVRRLSDPDALPLGGGGVSAAPGINLARAITQWWTRSERALPPEIREHPPGETLRQRNDRDSANRRRAEALKSLMELRQVAVEVTHRFFERPPIVVRMVRSEAFGELCEAACPGERDVVGKEWEGQTNGKQQQISEADLVLNGWLASRVLLTNSDEPKPIVGDQKSLITHFVIDEAQDISPNHVAVLRNVLDPKGTLTLVGDLHQRVSNRGYFQDWSDLGLEELRRAVFSVNHRQSQPLGQFVHALHSCLYGQAPLWRPSARRDSPRPRIRLSGTEQLSGAVLAEVQFWRRTIPDGTVAILFHGRSSSELRGLTETLTSDLAESLTDVRYAVGKTHAHHLNQTDCVLIASVVGTKGMEFDAVVVIDPDGTWASSVETMEELVRNGLYVAVSRAKQGLSMILQSGSPLLSLKPLQGLYDFIR